MTHRLSRISAHERKDESFGDVKATRENYETILKNLDRRIFSCYTLFRENIEYISNTRRNGGRRGRIKSIFHVIVALDELFPSPLSSRPFTGEMYLQPLHFDTEVPLWDLSRC